MSACLVPALESHERLVCGLGACLFFGACGSAGSTAEDLHEMVTCKLRGRRSPEFASGAFEEFCAELQEIASSHLLVVCTPLDEQQRSILVKDWHTATDASSGMF